MRAPLLMPPETKDYGLGCFSIQRFLGGLKSFLKIEMISWICSSLYVSTKKLSKAVFLRPLLGMSSSISSYRFRDKFFAKRVSSKSGSNACTLSDKMMFSCSIIWHEIA